MAPTRGKQIELLCKKVALDYDGWEYAAKAFKCKELKHTTKEINFAWTGNAISVSSQPIVAIDNKKIDKIWKVLGIGKRGWSQFLRVKIPSEFGSSCFIRFQDLEAENTEGYIRQVLDTGIQMLEDNWDFSSEEDLLRNLPVEKWPELLEDQQGICYCIARLLIGDFYYIERFYNDEIPTRRPKYKHRLEQIMEHIPEYKALYEKKGILYI